MLCVLVASCEPAVKSWEKMDERRNGWPQDILRKGFTLRGFNVSERKHLQNLFLPVLRATSLQSSEIIDTQGRHSPAIAQLLTPIWVLCVQN